MGAQSLDKEFLQYWIRLSAVEKQSLFQVAKHYVELKDDTTPISIDQYNAEIEEAMKRMDAGEFYTHDQVTEMSKGLGTRAGNHKDINQTVCHFIVPKGSVHEENGFVSLQ
jgi:hypothetical protein